MCSLPCLQEGHEGGGQQRGGGPGTSLEAQGVPPTAHPPCRDPVATDSRWQPCLPGARALPVPRSVLLGVVMRVWGAGGKEEASYM